MTKDSVCFVNDDMGLGVGGYLDTACSCRCCACGCVADVGVVANGEKTRYVCRRLTWLLEGRMGVLKNILARGRCCACWCVDVRGGVVNLGI
jgi:hypothetical protein